MAFYLVNATPRDEQLSDLRQKLTDNVFVDRRPFGPAISHSLRNARRRPNGRIVWTEEEYYTLPLAQERAAVLDDHFRSIEVEAVAEGDGWARIEGLPPLVSERAAETLGEGRITRLSSPSRCRVNSTRPPAVRGTARRRSRESGRPAGR